MRLTESEAEPLWRGFFEHALTACYHGPGCTHNNGNCNIQNRIYLQPFLGGCIMPLWSMLNSALASQYTTTRGAERQKPIKICRVRINDGAMSGRRLVGIKLVGYKWKGTFEKHGYKVEVTECDRNGQPTAGTAALNRVHVNSPPRQPRREGLRQRHRFENVVHSDSEDELVVVDQNSARPRPARLRRTVPSRADTAVPARPADSGHTATAPPAHARPRDSQVSPTSIDDRSMRIMYAHAYSINVDQQHSH